MKKFLVGETAILRGLGVNKQYQNATVEILNVLKNGQYRVQVLQVVDKGGTVGIKGEISPNHLHAVTYSNKEAKTLLTRR